MLARIITLRFSSLLDGFDDEPLRDFLKDKEVLALRDHFFVRNDVPYLAVVVNYCAPLLLPPVTVKAERAGKPEEGWRQLVSEADVPLFNSLRDWRAARCQREGVPPYIICTNRQLALMIVARPQSLAALGRIEGFGKAKLEKYGAEMLALLAQTPPAVKEEKSRLQPVLPGVPDAEAG